MAVYGTSPFAKYSSHTFESKHVTPIATYAASPPVAWSQSSSLGSPQQTQSGRFLQRTHASALAVCVLLACVLSIAYIMRPVADGTGNSQAASYLILLRKQAAALGEPQQQQDALHCKLVYSRQDGSTFVDTTLCTQQNDEARQRVTVWRNSHQHSRADSPSISSSYEYTYSSQESDQYGRKRVSMRKTLRHEHAVSSS